MYNFKEFFTKNFDHTILEARANRGTYIKKPTLLDEEDLDYLYQIDQSYWVEALQQRIQKTWNFLKRRQEIRNKIAREMLSEIKSKFGVSKTAAGGVMSIKSRNWAKRRIISIDNSNLGDLKNLILSIAEKYDNYGKNSSSPSSSRNREELSVWLDKLMDNYDLKNPSTRGSKDNFRTIRDLIYEVIKHIVIYVEGGDQEEYYVGDKKIKFYINRYIEKLETLPGDEHTIKTKLDHISQVYGKDIEFESHGKYGIDLSNARKVKSKNGKDIIYKAGSGAEGFNFSKISGVREALKNLYSLNYHRHYGSLPSDESDRDDVTYRIVKSGRTSPKELDDSEAHNTIQRNIFNFIKRFINNNKGLRSWNDPKVSDLLENSPSPTSEKEEMESGIWLIRYLLKNPNATESDLSKIDEDSFKNIFHDNYEKIEELKNKGKIGLSAFAWMTSWENIVGNVKLKNYFAEYFSDKRTKEIIKQESVRGPKILSMVTTGDPAKDDEIRKKEIEKISEKDREKLKEILGEDWESFQRTGRIPYKIRGNKLKIGSTRTDKKGKIIDGDSPKIILPYIKIGEGENSRSVPLLNAPSFIRSSLESDSENSEDTEKSLMTTSRSGIILGKDGKEIILNKFHKMPKYTHGSSGTRISGFRPEVSSQAPGSPHNKETRIGFAKIFPIGFPVMGSEGPLIDSNTWDYFKRNPDLIPEKATPMKYSYYDLIDSSSGNSSKRESLDLSNFKLIREANEYEYEDEYEGEYEDEGEDRDASGAKKGGKITSMYDKIRGSSYYEIKPAKDGGGDITGWDDIIEGMKQTFLNKKFGAGEANVIDIKRGIEEFQRLHDKVVDIFYINAKDEDLYTSLGRKTRASSEIGKLLQRKDEDLSTGSKARKSRTGTESMVIRTTKKSPQEEKINVGDLQPLAYDKSFDKQKRAQFTSIFFDTNNQIKFVSKSGRTWVPSITMPDSESPEPYVFRKNKKDLRAKLYSTSTVLRFLSENSEQVNNSNSGVIFEILEKEKNNLLSFWNTTFPKFDQSYKTNMDKIGGYENDLISYLELSNAEIIRTIKDVYEAEEEELKIKQKTSVAQQPQQEASVDSQISYGYNNLLEIIKEIEDIIEDESYVGKTFFHKNNNYDKKNPVIGNWYFEILGLARTLLQSNDSVKNERLIQVILKHIGGWSETGRLKYPTEAFLKKIFDNFNEFAKLLKVAPPNGVGSLATIRKQKDTIASQMPAVLTNIKSEFIKQAKAMKSEVK